MKTNRIQNISKTFFAALVLSMAGQSQASSLTSLLGTYEGTNSANSPCRVEIVEANGLVAVAFFEGNQRKLSPAFKADVIEEKLPAVMNGGHWIANRSSTYPNYWYLDGYHGRDGQLSSINLNHVERGGFFLGVDVITGHGSCRSLRKL